MKIRRIISVFAVLAVLSGACGKGHYDLDNVQGVALEGEVLLPLVGANYTIMEMMERFGIDSVVSFDGSGGMVYHYSYVHDNAVSGDELLSFRDTELYESWPLSTLPLQQLTAPIDTTVNYSLTVQLHSDYINVLSARVKSGKMRCKIGFGNAAVQIKGFRIHCSEIRDSQGNEFWYSMPQGADNMELDFTGFSFQTEEANTLHFDFQIEARLNPSSHPSGNLVFRLNIDDLAVSWMQGWMKTHTSYSQIVTDFNVFSDNVSGTLELNDVELRVYMRNGFNVPARLVVDTAEVAGPDFATIQLFESLPQVIEMDYSPAYEEIFYRSMSGVIGAHGAIATATSNFILNPDGLTNRITVADTCSVAVKADFGFPLSFTANEVHYIDTIEMNLSENLSETLPMLQSPEWIKKLTLELSLTSNLPLDLEGRIFVYDAENEEVTDILTDDFLLISASMDGQPVQRTMSIELTGERIKKMLQSNQMILDFGLDTQAREVELNANQILRLLAKCRVEYDGNVKLKNE